MKSIRVETLVGMAADHFERMQAEEAKVEQLVAAIGQRDQELARRDQRIRELETQIAGLTPPPDAAASPVPAAGDA